jgi:hypothetical protein
MKQSDFYQILQIDKNASMNEIKSSYIKLIKKYHPDKNKDRDAVEKFKNIQLAYQTLSNTEAKMKYDQLDNFDHASNLKDLFLFYQITVNNLCEKYHISNDDKLEIVNLFSPDDYTKELNQNDILAANAKLFKKIYDYLPFFLSKKLNNFWTSFFE